MSSPITTASMENPESLGGNSCSRLCPDRARECSRHVQRKLHNGRRGKAVLPTARGAASSGSYVVTCDGNMPIYHTRLSGRGCAAGRVSTRPPSSSSSCLPRFPCAPAAPAPRTGTRSTACSGARQFVPTGVAPPPGSIPGAPLSQRGRLLGLVEHAVRRCQQQNHARAGWLLLYGAVRPGRAGTQWQG